MRHPIHVIGVVVLAAGVFVTAATAFGQYYVPLRYDLRQGSPVYVPGREPWKNYGSYDAARYDPYSFSAVQSRNYYLTGNVRAGKSFQGTTPYGQPGSELATSLPSLRLSNFRRDSVGVEDLGSGVEYGAPLPYFPSTGEVSSGWSVREPTVYGRPGAGAPPYVGQGEANNWDVRAPQTYEPLSAYPAVPGAVAPEVTGQFEVSADTWAFLDRLMAEGASEPGAATPAAQPAEANPQGGAGQTAGLPYQPTFRFESRPDNLLNPGADGGPGGPQPTPTGQGLSLYVEPPPAAEVAPGQTPDSTAATSETPTEAPWIPLLKEGQPLQTSQAAAQYTQTLRAAHAAFKDAKFETAADLYHDASILVPSSKAALFGRVHSLLAYGGYYQVSLALERALMQHPDWAKDVPNLHAVYVAPATYDHIVSQLTERLKLQPDARELNFVLGYVLYAGGKKDEARPYLQKAAEAIKHLKGPEEILLNEIGGATAK